MADDPGADHLEDQQDDEGGPVKSFLEHLEDLRWVLIKSLAVAGVAMVGCFYAGNYIVRILERPLKRAPFHKLEHAQTVRVVLGTNELGVFHLGQTNPLTSITGTNPFVLVELTPIALGSNTVLALSTQSDAQGAQRDESPIDIVNLSPAGAFVVATKVALYGGLVVSAPFIFYFIAQFVFPALRMREKKYIYRGLGFAVGLFLTGVSFCYFLLMPVTLALSAQYSEWFGFKATQWRAEDYIGFVCKFMLGMGLGFELPVVILTLVKIGFLSYRSLAGARKYVIVISFVLGAILTTPEVITQVLMAVPLLILYEISVWIAWYWDRKEKKRERSA